MLQPISPSDGTPAAVSDPRIQSKVSRAWRVVAAAFLSGFAVYGIGVYSFGLFVHPLLDEFHWSYAVTGGLIAAFYFSAPISLATDTLIRRVGVKRMVISGILIEAGAFICFPIASNLWLMYFLRALGGLGKILFIIAQPVILSRWFSRRFGTAIAIMNAGWLLGGVATASVTEYLIHSFGWRGASIVLGVALLVIALPPALWMLRVESAAAMGLGLDDEILSIVDSSTSSSRHGDVPTPTSGARAPLGELLRHAGFQLLVVTSILYLLANIGVFTLEPAIVESVGASGHVASIVFASSSAFGVVGTLIGGYIMDRFPLNRAVTIQYVLMGSGILSLLMFVYLSWGWMLALHAATFGLAVGGNAPMWLTLVKRKIPAVQFSRTWGVYYFLVVASAIAAPIATGWLRDLTGSFIAALTIDVAFVVISMPLCIILVRRAEVNV